MSVLYTSDLSFSGDGGGGGMIYYYFIPFELFIKEKTVSLTLQLLRKGSQTFTL